MKKKSLAVIGMVVCFTMMVSGAALAAKPDDKNDGTVIVGDYVYLKDASCLGSKTFDQAKSAVASLAVGQCDLKDGSKAGDWRLLDRSDLRSFTNARSYFSNLHDGNYWTLEKHGGDQYWVKNLLTNREESTSRNNSAWVLAMRNKK